MSADPPGGGPNENEAGGMNTSSIMLATNVNEILSRYIVIHDHIMKFSVRKILPVPGLFKSIPYCTYEGDLATLLVDPRSCKAA